MSDSARHYRWKAKALATKPKDEESYGEGAVEHFAGMAEEILTNCMKSTSYDPWLVKHRLREVMRIFAGRHREKPHP